MLNFVARIVRLIVIVWLRPAQVTEVLELNLVQKRLLNTGLGAVRLRLPAPGNIKTEALQKEKNF
jgi:hypothetical protein